MKLSFDYAARACPVECVEGYGSSAQDEGISSLSGVRTCFCPNVVEAFLAASFFRIE